MAENDPFNPFGEFIPSEYIVSPVMQLVIGKDCKITANIFWLGFKLQLDLCQQTDYTNFSQKHCDMKL